jgi:hypothetical protein
MAWGSITQILDCPETGMLRSEFLILTAKYAASYLATCPPTIRCIRTTNSEREQRLNQVRGGLGSVAARRKGTREGDGHALGIRAMDASGFRMSHPGSLANSSAQVGPPG